MEKLHFREIARIGLIAGVVAASVSVIGMVETFDQRDLITNILTLGQVLLFIPPAAAGFLAARLQPEEKRVEGIVSGIIAGFFAALPVVAVILLTVIAPDIRDKLVNVSPALIEILTFGQGEAVGSLILIAVMTLLGAGGAAIHVLPQRIERPVLMGLLWTLLIALLSDVLIGVLRPLLGTSGVRLLFGTKGLKPLTALVVFVIVTVVYTWYSQRGKQLLQQRAEARTPEQQRRLRRTQLIVGVLLLLLLPLILGTYLTEVVDVVGIFILMGLGLNIVVGFAGLLDLGYVAFFAIGAYTLGILTSEGDLGAAGMGFWTALPFAVGASVLAGIILGTPVLRMRGDYLAIVTLGFGEIIRVLATSDLLKPYIGGAQGVLQIPKPQIASFEFVEPREFYYLILAGCALVAFVAWRLRDARLGRQWMAMREDEDVAEAMGIHLVTRKLLAFAIGAAFSGLAGAIFASRLSSIFPHSFNLLISINVLSLIIVGGIGSLPGVVVGALVLIGLPELLREFAEYRLLMYGALLIAMMIAKPEGLWPSPVARRELHAGEEIEQPSPTEAPAGALADASMANQIVETQSTGTSD
jgi:branched-chain amino acid transport system permease protein